MLGLVIASLVRLAETRLGEALVRSPWLDWLSGVVASYVATLLLIGCVALVFYFIPEHAGAVPRRLAGRDPGRRAVARRVLGCSRGTRATWRRWNVIHGSIAAVVVFLLWIYVSAVILLYGVEMTASYARLQDAAVRHTTLSKELQA